MKGEYEGRNGLRKKSWKRKMLPFFWIWILFLGNARFPRQQQQQQPHVTCGRKQTGKTTQPSDALAGLRLSGWRGFGNACQLAAEQRSTSPTCLQTGGAPPLQLQCPSTICNPTLTQERSNLQRIKTSAVLRSSLLPARVHAPLLTWKVSVTEDDLSIFCLMFVFLGY